jgi:3-oxoadipate CoA-transferase alpha subunit
MAIDKRWASATTALADVADGASVMISGFGGAGFPNVLIRALREAGPRNLTLVVNSATHRFSLTHELIEAGQVRRVICTAARGHEATLSPFEQLFKEGQIELECVPQGTFSERIRAGGAGIPAFYTPVSVGTPLAAGKETRVFDGRVHVLEHAIRADIALIRADRADRYGNLAFRYAQANFGPAMATASRVTVAEVRAFEDAPLPHTEIQLPGVFVRRAVAVGDAR